jgi:DNA gyrase subunit B
MSSDASGYIASGGLHGVGASCVNALSDKMRVEVQREGGLWVQEYERGIPKDKVKMVRKLERGERKTGRCDCNYLRRSKR